MSTLQTRSFASIVGSIAAGMQGRITSRFLNFALGSMLRGIAEAYAGIVLWLQKDAIDIAKLTRLATSYGTDVDSFVADFPLSGATRFGAQAATTLCNFSRYTATGSPVYVPVGGQVKTGDGTQVFQVYADTTNPAFVASYGASGAYRMPAQVSTVTAPVISITNGVTGAPGANGNVAAGSISLISSSMPGVDTVTNLADVTNGSDSEPDDSVKARFQLAVQGRGGGTVPAYESAIANLKQGMTSIVLENQDTNGNVVPGMITIFVDDGSGNISSALLAAARSAANSVRAASIQLGVYAATTTGINVVMSLGIKAGYIRTTVVAQVSAALALYINGLGQGATVPYFDLPAITKTVPGVAEILPGTYTLNAGTVDIAGSPSTTPKAINMVIN